MKRSRSAWYAERHEAEECERAAQDQELLRHQHRQARLNDELDFICGPRPPYGFAGMGFGAGI